MIDKTEEDKKRLRYARHRMTEIIAEIGFNVAPINYTEDQINTLAEAAIDGYIEADSAIDEVPW